MLQPNTHLFLRGGGEMGELTRNFNWSETAVGTPNAWPYSLKITVSNMLRSRFPMFLWWGPELIQFYNDAYRPSLGNEGKHPRALGQRGKECWPEIWPVIYPLIQQVQKTGEPTWMEDQLIPIYRNGRLEDVYWTFSYGQVLDDHGQPGGVLVICMETTETVKGRIQLQHSEAKLRSILNSAPTAMGVFAGPDLIVENPNQLLIDLMDAGPDIEGRSFRQLLAGLVEEDQKFIDLIDTVRTTGQSFEAQDVPVFFKHENKTRYFNISFIPLRDENGTVYAVLDVSVDISEQVASRKSVELAQQKIEASQRTLLTLFEESPVGIATLSADNLFVFETANAFYATLVGRNPEDIINKPLLEALPELKGQGFDELLQGVISTGKAFTADGLAAAIARNGTLETIYVNLTYQPRKDADGKVTGILVVASDVTEQVRSRKKIEDSEQYTRSLFYNSPVAVLVYVGPNMILREANEKMLEIFGRNNEIIGKPIMDAIPELKATPLLASYRRVLETGTTHHEYAEKIMLLKGGQPYFGFYDYTYKALYNSIGDVYGVICTAVDVTEQIMARRRLEENESALERALEQARLSKEAAELGTFDMDLEKGFMHWDDRCRTLFGISHHQPVTYEKDFVEGLHPDDRDRILAVIEKSFIKAASNGEYDVEYRTIGAEDGLERWVKAKGKVYFNQSEKPVRFIGSVLDITEQMNAIQKIEKIVEERTRELATTNIALQTANKELQRSNQNLEEFAHAASHDLKEPIRKITFFTHRLKEQLGEHLKDNELRSFGRIEDATGRMSNLIDDLLLYSHASQRPHETEAVDLNLKVQRVMEDLELDIEEKKAIINVGKLPVVHGYRRQLQQLFQNLISNALKYSKADSPPEVSITSKIANLEDKAYNLIEVKDNGIGFDQQYADQIFKMFARLHGKEEYSGTGVGLSIVKKVIENHDGFIEVQSEPGIGSTFSVYLPV